MGEQVDAGAFCGPMLPAQRRAAGLKSLRTKGERSFMSCWWAPGRQEGMESLHDHQDRGFAGT